MARPRPADVIRSGDHAADWLEAVSLQDSDMPRKRDELRRLLLSYIAASGVLVAAWREARDWRRP